MLLLLVHASPVAGVPLVQVHVLVVQIRSCTLSGACVSVSPSEQDAAHAAQPSPLK